MTTAPTLHTQHLTLQAPTMSDFDAYCAFHGSKRAEFIMILNKEDSWYSFAAETAHWSLFGFGPWVVHHTADQKPVGFIGTIQHHFPNPELIWMVYADYEGKGLAYEATCAARDWLFENTDLDSVVSLVHPKNDRSIALAKRLGAVQETDPNVGADKDLVFRHLKPEAQV